MLILLLLGLARLNGLLNVLLVLLNEVLALALHVFNYLSIHLFNLLQMLPPV